MSTTIKDPDKPRGIIARAVQDVVRASGKKPAWIAKKADITRQHLYKIMSGQASTTIDTLTDIFKACGADFAKWLQPEYGHNRRLHDILEIALKKEGLAADGVRLLIEGMLKSTSGIAEKLS